MKHERLSEEEKRSSAEATRQVVAWARSRGYSDVYFMGADEANGDRLRAERDSFEAIHKGGGKIWVACSQRAFDIVGDLLDCMVLLHPGDAIRFPRLPSRDWLLHRLRLINLDPQFLMTPELQKIINGVHKNGYKVLTYMDPLGGWPVPEHHRRNRGLGLWKTGLDGTMTWAYAHTWTKTIRFGDQEIKDNGVSYVNSFILRAPRGPIDTLAWEGYREGCDDARYLATLQDALAKAKVAGKNKRLVARTERWLGDLSVNADLDEWRLEMARRTEALLKH